MIRLTGRTHVSRLLTSSSITDWSTTSDPLSLLTIHYHFRHINCSMSMGEIFLPSFLFLLIFNASSFPSSFVSFFISITYHFFLSRIPFIFFNLITYFNLLFHLFPCVCVCICFPFTIATLYKYTHPPPP